MSVTDRAAASTSSAPREPATKAALPLAVPLAGLLVLLTVTLYRTLRPLTDPDVWWHLRLGADFLAGRSLSDPGRFGAFSHDDWVPTQWLPEVVVAWVSEHLGLAGVAWLFAASVLVLVGVLYRLARSGAEPLAALVVTSVAVIGMSASISPRPHVLSYLLLAVTLAAWLRTARDLRPRWWLVGVSWLWASCHGMWFSGVVLGVVVLAGLLLDRRPDRRTALRLALVPLLSVLAAALTPVGPRLLAAPLAVGEISGYITEWAAPSFREPGPATAAAMVGIVVAAWARTGGVPWHRVLLLATAAGWILLSARTVTVGTVIVLPLLAPVVQAWLRRPAPRPGRVETVTLLAGTVALLVVAAVVAPRVADEPGQVPSGLSSRLSSLPEGTLLLDEYRLGGWLSWRHPHLEYFVDGLTESYTPEHLAAYGRLVAAQPGWQEIVEETGAEHALLDEGMPVAVALQQQLGWRVVGRDAPYVLLVAP